MLRVSVVWLPACFGFMYVYCLLVIVGIVVVSCGVRFSLHLLSLFCALIIWFAGFTVFSYFYCGLLLLLIYVF